MLMVELLCPHCETDEELLVAEHWDKYTCGRCGQETKLIKEKHVDPKDYISEY